MNGTVLLVTANGMGKAEENLQLTLIYICSTCLIFFELAEKVKVGIVGGMGDILEAQMKADKVITI